MNIQIGVSCHLLSDRQLFLSLLQLFASVKKSIILREEGCQCASHSEAIDKLRMVCQQNQKAASMFSIKIWSSRDLITPAQLDSHSFNIVLQDSDEQHPQLGNATSVIPIREISQLDHLLELSVFELEKRCRLEQQLRRSHARYRLGRGKEVIKDLANRYYQIRMNRQGKQLLAFMKFNSKSYLSVLKKYFNLWLIAKYERGIEQINSDLVQNNTINQSSSRALQQKCFFSWKSFIKLNREKREIFD